MSDLLSHFDTQIQNQEQLLREREQELEQLRRQRVRLAELQAQRDELLNQMRAVENEIAVTERTMTSSLNRFNNLISTTPAATAPTPAPAAPRAAESVATPTVAVPPSSTKPSTLREEIRKVLSAARTRLTGPEIAEQLLASGYKTSSTNFLNVVKKTLFEMDEVSHLRGQGYKLKR
jgi:small-conductance mechanosensitive channel